MREKRAQLVATSVAIFLVAFAVVDVAPAAIRLLTEERQAGMRTMADAARDIDAMFRGTRSYTAAVFVSAARALHDNSGDAMRSRFPDESLGAPSAANPEIAANREAFDQIADRLETLSAHLAEFADQAPDVITDDMRMGDQPMTGGSLLGARSRTRDEDLASTPPEHVFHLIMETCTTCHARFRTRQ